MERSADILPIASFDSVDAATFAAHAIARYIYIPRDMLKSLALPHEPSA